MDIREATPDDVEVIQQVARASWTADYPEIVSRETATEGVDQWYDADQLTAEINRADARVLVAERDGAVVGFVHAVWADEEGNVLRLYVDPDHRGDGIGSSLLDAVVTRLFDEGVDRVRAMVLADNEPGNDFYRAQGFEQSEEVYETEIGGEFFDERVWVLEERPE